MSDIESRIIGSRSRSADKSDNEAEITPADDPKSSFQATFINPTTVLIIEDDSYFEQPLIYIKIYDDLLIITDTGTSSPRQKQPSPSLTLRTFLETVPIAHPTTFPPTNASPKANHAPLNPSGKKRYIIICTHAHYDHILGIPHFLDATPPPFIVASAHDPSFITTDLPTHSLCKYLHVPTPVYTISHWARHLEFLAHPDASQPPSAPLPHPLRIRCLHIPGHTPDSLAWYDIDEQHLYIGDMFYRRTRDAADAFPPRPLPAQDAAIVFPVEGDWVAYMASLDLLVSFAAHENARLEAEAEAEAQRGGSARRVRVACGHVTFAGDAEAMARGVRALFGRILAGRVPVVRSFLKRGVVFDVWRESEQSRYFVEAPRRLYKVAMEEGRV